MAAVNTRELMMMREKIRDARAGDGISTRAGRAEARVTARASRSGEARRRLRGRLKRGYIARGVVDG